MSETQTPETLPLGDDQDQRDDRLAMSETQTPETLPSKATIKVYVRRENGGRILSFRPPADITTATLLENDLALDGNTAMIGIAQKVETFWDDNHDEQTRMAGYSVPGVPDDYPTLSAALLAVEKWLVQWLGERGYSVDFA